MWPRPPPPGVRELSRGGRRKNDVIDASAAASVAALQGDASGVAGGDTTVFTPLEERRADLAAQRVRVVNQLHAIFRDLLPGGARTDLSAMAAAAVLRTVRPAPPMERTGEALARDLACEMRRLDASLADMPAA